uniref:Uncharacterized protein n=1 Tax=Ananas comosus var. bracteatus TaxID=296719 RepID=A0A6V7PJ88_ANACO|nr:unnamed protein product [Ananas comosus var. bracteatus]
MAAASLSPPPPRGSISFLGARPRGDTAGPRRASCRRRTADAAAAAMGNVNEGKGLFAPIVVLVRNVVGRKRFNQLRGKVIALHSQYKLPTVITEFCKTIGADSKQRQGIDPFGEEKWGEVRIPRMKT